MTVFKYFLKLAWRKKASLIIYLVLFIVLTFNLFNANVSKANESFKDIKYKGAVINNDKSPVANALEDYIKKTANMVPGVTKDNKNQLIYQGNIDFYIEIPEGFGERFSKEDAKVSMDSDPDFFEVTIYQNKIEKFLMFLASTRDDNGNYDYNKVNEVLAKESKVTILSKESFNSRIIAQLFNFMAYSSMAVFIFTLGSIMSEFNKEAIEMRNRSLPISTTRFSLEILLGQIVTSIIIITSFIIPILILYKDYLKNFPLVLVIINALAYTLACLGFAFLLCNISTDRSFLYGVSNAFPLGLAFISGSMVPLELLPSSVIKFAKVFPMYYYNLNNLDIEASTFWQNIIILVLFGIMYFTIGVILTRIRKGEPLLTPREASN